MVYDAGIIGDGGIGAIVGEGDAPNVGTKASPTADDDFAVVSNFTSNGVEVNFSSGVVEDRHVDEVVGDWSAVSFVCFLGELDKEQLQGASGEE